MDNSSCWGTLNWGYMRAYISARINWKWCNFVFFSREEHPFRLRAGWPSILPLSSIPSHLKVALFIPLKGWKLRPRFYSYKIYHLQHFPAPQFLHHFSLASCLFILVKEVSSIRWLVSCSLVKHLKLYFEKSWLVLKSKRTFPRKSFLRNTKFLIKIKKWRRRRLSGFYSFCSRVSLEEHSCIKNFIKLYRNDMLCCLLHSCIFNIQSYNGNQMWCKGYYLGISDHCHRVRFLVTVIKVENWVKGIGSYNESSKCVSVRTDI